MKARSVLDEHMDPEGVAAGDLPTVSRQIFLNDSLRIKKLAACEPYSHRSAFSPLV